MLIFYGGSRSCLPVCAPGVSADRETLAEVEQAVEPGYTVILPEKETVLNDWKGTGYLILNPETGAGAYRISGGLSGGSTSTAVTIAGVCAVIVLICLLVLLAVGIVNLLAFMYAAALGLAAQAVCALLLLLMLESYGGLAIRISNLTEAVRKQAAGDASQEEYILWEFLMSAAEIAVAVGLMAVFAYIEGRPSKGESGSGGGKDQGNGSGSGNEDSGGSGSGNGSGTEGNGSENGSGDSGGSGTGSGGNGSGETGAGGNGNSGTGTGGSGRPSEKLNWDAIVSKKGETRVDHINRHAVPNNSRETHGVFNGNPVDMVNEAWEQRHLVEPLSDGMGGKIYNIPYKNAGYESGYVNTGAQMDYITIITMEENTDLITAFPSFGNYHK